MRKSDFSVRESQVRPKQPESDCETYTRDPPALEGAEESISREEVDFVIPVETPPPSQYILPPSVEAFKN